MKLKESPKSPKDQESEHHVHRDLSNAEADGNGPQCSREN